MVCWSILICSRCWYNAYTMLIYLEKFRSKALIFILWIAQWTCLCYVCESMKKIEILLTLFWNILFNFYEFVHCWHYPHQCVQVAKDPTGKDINALEQHIKNLLSPSTPHFFNTLYDPYREGADFVRGYPFSMREGQHTAVSHGLWLNIPDYDAPTQLVKPRERNTRHASLKFLRLLWYVYNLWSLLIVLDLNVCLQIRGCCPDDPQGNPLPDVWYEFGIQPWSHRTCNVLWTYGRRPAHWAIRWHVGRLVHQGTTPALRRTIFVPLKL